MDLRFCARVTDSQRSTVEIRVCEFVQFCFERRCDGIGDLGKGVFDFVRRCFGRYEQIE